MHKWNRALLVLLVLACDQGCAPRTVCLRFTPQPGDSFQVRINHKLQMAMTYGSFKDSGMQWVSTEEHSEVRSVDSKGIAQLDTTMASFHVDMTNKGALSQYNSRFPSRHSSLRTLPFELALGQKVHYSVDEAGRLVQFKGPQAAILKQLAVRTPQLRFTPEITEQSLRTSILEHFGDVALREAYALNSVPFPVQELRVGDSWKREVSVTKGIPMIFAFTYTLVEISPHLVVVAATATIRSNPAVPYTDLGAQDIKYLIKGTQTNRFHIHPRSGRTTKSEMKQQISGRFGLQQHPPPGAIVGLTRSPWNLGGTIMIYGRSHLHTLEQHSAKVPTPRHRGARCSAAAP